MTKQTTTVVIGSLRVKPLFFFLLKKKWLICSYVSHYKNDVMSHTHYRVTSDIRKAFCLEFCCTRIMHFGKDYRIYPKYLDRQIWANKVGPDQILHFGTYPAIFWQISRQLTQSDSIGRVSALWLGGCGFNPRPSHTKDFKNGPSCSFTLRSALRK